MRYTPLEVAHLLVPTGGVAGTPDVQRLPDRRRPHTIVRQPTVPILSIAVWYDGSPRGQPDVYAALQWTPERGRPRQDMINQERGKPLVDESVATPYFERSSFSGVPEVDSSFS